MDWSNLTHLRSANYSAKGQALACVSSLEAELRRASHPFFLVYELV